nr:ACT domain-containing protein [Micromonospora sp. DSM 115978]
VEVRAPDRAGVLFRVTNALSGIGLNVQTAVVSTLGLDVVDAFYVQERDGGQVTGGQRREVVSQAVLAALAD